MWRAADRVFRSTRWQVQSRSVRTLLGRTMKTAVVSCLLLVSSAGPGLACLCVAPLFREAYDASDAVFAGVVTDAGSETLAGHVPCVEFSFKTIRIWKGADLESVSVQTPRDDGACGFRFALGDTYLVYARLDDDALRTDRCTRTRRLAEATIDLALLPVSASSPSEQAIAVTPLDRLVAERLRSFQCDAFWETARDLFDLIDSHEKLVPQLISIAADSVNYDSNKRRAAVQILGSYGYHSRSAVPVLLDLVCSEDRDLRQTVVYSLRNVFPECAAVVSEYFEPWIRFDPDECARLVDTLRTIGLASLPPDSLLAAGGKTGPMFFIK